MQTHSRYPDTAPAQPGRTTRRGALTLAFALAAAPTLSACGEGEILNPGKLTAEQQAAFAAQAKEEAIPDSVKHCRPDYRRELPTATNARQLIDDRDGGVYPCMYLGDAGIPYNKPVNLVKTEERTVETSSFKATGNLGGVAVLGFGVLNGNISASDSSDKRQMVAITFPMESGGLKTAYLDKEINVTLNPCATACGLGNVTIKIPDTMLWEKNNGDDSSDYCTGGSRSIWVSDGIHHTPNEVACQTVASQVALAAPNDDTSQGQYHGGPASIGRIMNVLASDIVINYPAGSNK